ncbi:MAG: class I SAM-dependent methyltransferase [Rickettsiales bacterium]|nr:class I SAM-dependent methyltransferase [Rickettsiales bacterium]
MMLFNIVAIFSILIFTWCCFFAIYLMILLIWSKGFKNSPTVSSNSKSIKIIADYIQKYIIENKFDKIRILDIGSGYGKMLSGVEKDLNKIQISRELIGYEISNFPYKISNIFNKSKNIKFIHDDIFNLKDFNFDIVITFILAKQQKLFLDIYRKFPKGTLIIANSLSIPFEEKDSFKLIDTMRVCYHWNIYIYKKI